MRFSLKTPISIENEMFLRHTTSDPILRGLMAPRPGDGVYSSNDETRNDDANKRDRSLDSAFELRIKLVL